MINNKNYKLDLANLPDKKLMFKVAKEMSSHEKALGNKSTRDKSPLRLLQSPAIMASGKVQCFYQKNLMKFVIG